MKLSIFTPVYNRKNLLLKLYHSLIAQTCLDFNWIIIDDGSTDGAEDLVRSLIKQSPFEIIYQYQKNQGKHVAHNKALEMCQTELFLCIDSDDTLLQNAVEDILRASQEHKNDNILGFFFRKVDVNGRISGGSFHLNDPYIGLRDIYHKKNFNGELAIVLYTERVKEYIFPKFQGEKFVSELVFYNKINNIAKMFWIDKTIYSFEYQDSGYTKNAQRLIYRNPYGTACGYLSEAYYSYDILSKTKNCAMFYAIIKVFHLNKAILLDPKIKIPPFIKMMSVLLIPHYIRLFRIIKRKYSVTQ